MAGKLFIVPTPVGNLDDMTFRAVETLKEADLILAEDTRTSGVLLKHFGIETPMRSHHKFNEHETSARVAEQVEGGMTVALISDAGTHAFPRVPAARAASGMPPRGHRLCPCAGGLRTAY